MHHTKLNYYTATWLNNATFLSTYRGLPIVKLEPRAMGSRLTLHTHGFITRTTVRVLNASFTDLGIPWRATLRRGHIEIKEPSNTHTIGDIEYVIFTNSFEKNSQNQLMGEKP